jgi:superfamily II DNA/RNA helicase
LGAGQPVGVDAQGGVNLFGERVAGGALSSAMFKDRGRISTTGLATSRQQVLVALEVEDLLVTTDVLSEGQNLQQARYIVNYDMPWNPMRLVQRDGRIDRLNCRFAGQEIYLYNLFPAGELDEILKLYERLMRKVGYANISVGMEAPVFEDAAAVERNFADTSEQIRGIAGEDEGILEAAEA